MEKTFKKLQEERIKVYKQFDRLLSELKKTKNEGIYQMKVKDISEEFSRISKDIRGLIESTKDDELKKLMEKTQHLEKEHFEIEIALHRLTIVRLSEEKKYKSMLLSDEKMFQNQFYFDGNVAKDGELFRGEKLERVEGNISEIMQKKQDIIIELNDIDYELRFLVSKREEE